MKKENSEDPFSQRQISVCIFQALWHEPSMRLYPIQQEEGRDPVSPEVNSITECSVAIPFSQSFIAMHC
jgi:hypothetical protein